MILVYIPSTRNTENAFTRVHFDCVKSRRVIRVEVLNRITKFTSKVHTYKGTRKFPLLQELLLVAVNKLYERKKTCIYEITDRMT